MPTKAIAELSADAAILIGHFSGLPKGTTVSYADIATLIGWDIRTNRSVMNTVKTRLRKDHHRVLGAVFNQGYRVLTDAEVAEGELARDRACRRRSALKSKSKAGTVDLAALAPPQQMALLSEVTTAHITAEASRDKSVKQIGQRLNGSQQPLALNHALDAIKRNLTDK